ncbi:MAG TPA: GAF domain-containing protein, partial [Spirochaetales bacterium]|nr:GAF domain-containing protein [Spirochaetales bacterium]
MAFLQQIVSLPFIISFFFFALLVPFFIYIRTKDTEGNTSGFIVLSVFLFIKSVISTIFTDRLVWTVALIAFFAVTACVFILPYKKRRVWLYLLIVLNIIVSAVLIIQPMVKALEFFTQPILYAFLVIDLAAIAVLWFFNKKYSETITHVVLNAIIPWALASMLLYTVLGLLIGITADIYTRFITPLSYWWLVYAALRFLREHDAEMVAATNYYEETFDSLYNLFMKTGTVLKDSFEAGDILRSLNEAIHEEIHADGSMIFMVDEFDEQLSAKAYTGNYPPPIALPEGLPKKENRIVSWMKHIQFDYSSNILGECAKSIKNIYIPDASLDSRIVQNGDEDFLRITSFIAVPLMVEDKVMGVYTAVKTQPGTFFSENDFDRTKILANFGTISLSNFLRFLEVKERSNIQQSADTAAQIQKAMLPKKLPQYKTLQLGAFLQPSVGVSGDYYDVIQTRKDRVVIVIGDI